MNTVARDRKKRSIRRSSKRTRDAARPQQQGAIKRPPPLQLERQVMRVVALAGTVGIGVAVAAIMGSQGSSPWLIGLVVSVLTLLLAMIVLWASRRLEIWARPDVASVRPSSEARTGASSQRPG